MSFSYNGKPVSPAASRVCVLYDPADGRIVHVHTVTTLPGGKRLSLREMEKRTFERAKASGHLTAKLRAIHPTSRSFDHSMMYKVDVKQRKLVRLERPVVKFGKGIRHGVIRPSPTILSPQARRG